MAHSSGSLLNIAVAKYGHFTADDVRFVASAGADYGVVVVRADSRFAPLSTLMQALKADPGGTLIGAGGSIGSQDWGKGALLMQAAGGLPKSMRYVAFDGGGEAISELRAHVNGGKMRVLADKRLPAAFAKAYKTSEFARIRDEHGLHEFSLSGQAFHAHVNRLVKVLRDVVESAGLVRRRGATNTCQIGR